MSFDDLLTDTVSLLKQDGKKVDGIKASVQKGKIFIQRSDLVIEPGDLIRRRMSNGAEETYKVIDPGFHEAFHDIPAGYQIDVRKLGVPEAASAAQNITYNISGVNNRINQNSTDNSINRAVIYSEVKSHIDALREEIRRQKIPEEEKVSANEIIDAVETQFEGGVPNKTVIKTLLSALPNAASIASIGSFIISCL